MSWHILGGFIGSPLLMRLISPYRVDGFKRHEPLQLPVKLTIAGIKQRDHPCPALHHKG